jgi:hypothetical protein
MANTLEEDLKRQEKRLGKDSYVAKMLRNQIAAEKRHKSAFDAYTHGRDDEDDKE